jgi:hypothetical protein
VWTGSPAWRIREPSMMLTFSGEGHLPYLPLVCPYSHSGIMSTQESLATAY